MMMRPRNYGTLNRSIARGVSYALRSYKPTKRQNEPYVHHNNSNDTNYDNESAIAYIKFFAIAGILVMVILRLMEV